MIDTTLLFDTDITVKHYDATKQDLVLITDDHEIFVQHDFNASYKMIRDIEDRRNMKIKKYKARLERAEIDFRLPAPEYYLHARSTSVPDVRVTSSKRFHHISHVPRKYVASTWISSDDSSHEHKKQVPCFLCGKKVTWKNVP